VVMISMTISAAAISFLLVVNDLDGWFLLDQLVSVLWHIFLIQKSTMPLTLFLLF